MRKMLFIRLFAVLSSLLHIGCTNGMWISNFSGYQHSNNKRLSSEQTMPQDKFDGPGPLPFPPFLSFLLSRNISPFTYASTEDGETKDKLTNTLSSVKYGEKPFLLKDSVNDNSFHNNASTGEQADKITVIRPQGYIQKLTEPTTKIPTFGRLADPLSRSKRFRYFQTIVYKYRKPYNTEKKLNTNQNATLRGFNGSKADLASLTALKKEKFNCTQSVYMFRYYFIGGRNNSFYVIIMVTLIILIALLLPLGVFFCLNKQREEWSRKQKDVSNVKHISI